MTAQSSAAASSSISLSQKVSNVISGCPQDYNAWRSLILELETASPEDINTISLAYDSFLSRFPLCHWHLEKYAHQKAKFCNSQEAVDIYERAVEVAMYSVGFWADYFTFAATCFESPVDIRRLFERAISFVGKDYFCHVLWDKYMKYEFNQEGWSFLAQSYIWALRFPTKKLRLYYDNFKQFVANLEEEIGYEKYDSTVEQLSVPCAAIDLSKDEISLVIKDMLDSSDRPLKSKALDRYRSIGEEFYLEACRLDEKVKRFETKIQRRFFDVTPLDDDQLINWHIYLDFIEKQDNLDWAMKLYERCLIPCAHYPEFWIRYVEFLESKGGRELAISALARATQIFLKSVPEIHLFDARFKEHIGDADGARAALALCDPKTDSSFIESIAAQANLERRLGNFAAASATYEKALIKAREKQKLHHLPTLYVHFARLTYLTTGSTSASRDVLIKGIQQVPHCRILLEELVKFAMTHEGVSHLNIINSLIADAISPGLDENEGLDAKDRENISCLFLEFVNLCGTLHDIREAWNRHVKLFPQSLRFKTPSKHPASGSYPIGSARDKKGKYDHPVLSQPSTNHSDQHHGQGQVPESPARNRVHPNEVVRKPAPLMDQSSNAKEKQQLLLTKEVLSNGDESQDSEPAKGVSCQSREDGLRPMVVAAEFSDHAKENALAVRDSDQNFSSQSRGDEPGLMDVSAELGIQSKEDEVGKSTETTESIEACPSSLPNVEAELDHELSQLKRSASSDHNSLKSQENESRELIPMSCDEYGTSPKSIHSVDSLKVRGEFERDGTVSRQHNAPTEVHYPEGPSSTCDDSIELDRVVQPPGHAASRLQGQDQAQDRELKLQQSPYADSHKLVMNQGRGRRSQLEVGAVRDDKATEQDEPVMNQGNAQQYPASQQHSQSEDRATDVDQQTDALTPPTSISISAGQQPFSTQPFSHAQQNPTAPTTQQQWPEQQSLAMNQMMLQYHYQQQQFLQQQYQQQLQMQHPYYQMQHQYMNQQPPQSQQQYVEQQQHPQIQQGHEPQPNSQQAHDNQYQQSQDNAYQAHQLAYKQHASQEQQQLLWQQQYQQYQGYQLLQQQQQGSMNTQGHNVHHHPSRQPDEHLQQYHHQAHTQHKFTQPMSQNRQGTPDYAAAGVSSSPAVGARSPQASQ
ncbi:pre-mRNA-processing factor 39-2 isoform X2 [Salvia miltiorrhiza]|uniref:pre-mRNA-processing factor 39-2 isoform X2 n=1 Tax=Salvia miltiorrhiza TaxID=226208 RepID=UPI0025AD1A04|nr:pre-mRNA-processing factor 39-2 isoform X2 [Salvia miltiorrhiza]